MARKRLVVEPENHDRWLVSYADFITLLFAFFVVMYAISSVDVGKYKVLTETMNRAFDKPESSKPHHAVDVGDLNATGHVIGEGGADAAIIDMEIGAQVSSESKNQQNDKLTADVLAKQSDVVNQLNIALKKFTDNSLVEIKTNGELIIVEMKSKMLFPVGSSRLSLEATAALTASSKVLSNIPNHVMVEGHTDNIPIRTRAYPSNWELSAARAASVVHYLAQKGIAPTRLGAVGYGEFRPIASNNIATGRQKNRRVSLIVSSGDSLRGDYE